MHDRTVKILSFCIIIHTLGHRSMWFLFSVCWHPLALVLLSHYHMFLCKIHSINFSHTYHSVVV